ncbi:hypothetical protein [Streptomyces sp. AK02-04a]|uniref:hypothetical protein n=1 Tax=Streptomyces sp. AK02-04a TaxID=3028649 RepID=UPI0029A5EC3D|nr:hypothetical protein [Streptomyces sp. AK02-04a]MDX3758685.1 hypothetical protein [Streptomyces sp. AK02-04a]
MAHGIIAREVRPVYSVDDPRSTSRTLALGRGSCSQRMAVLEAVARAVAVPTRVRGLLVDGVFWYPRFPRLKPLVPEQGLAVARAHGQTLCLPARTLAEPVLGRWAAGGRARPDRVAAGRSLLSHP